MTDKEGWFFCNNWECEHRKNEKYKIETLCDLVYDGCPYDDEFYKSLRNNKKVEE